MLPTERDSAGARNLKHLQKYKARISDITGHDEAERCNLAGLFVRASMHPQYSYAMGSLPRSLPIWYASAHRCLSDSLSIRDAWCAFRLCLHFVSCHNSFAQGSTVEALAQVNDDEQALTESLLPLNQVLIVMVA